jgi:hypothetical protein
MKQFILAAALLAAAAPVAAQQAGPANDAPAATGGSENISQLVVYGNDPCPASTDDTIVVCARKPEADRFRIPEDLRESGTAQQNESWTTRATELQYVGRSGIGSCSPVGSGGSSGCFQELVRAARAERAGRPSVSWNRLIQEARQERLGRIDEEAEAEEAAVRAEEGE